MKNLFGVIFTLTFLGCNNDFIPKPKGFPRIDLPTKKHIQYKSNCPFTFEYPSYSIEYNHKGENTMPCWLNIEFPSFKGTIHISYLPITNNESLKSYAEDARSLAYKHTIKAQSINESFYENTDKKTYGTVYQITGKNTASSIQFFLTDSSTHFLRGALYFNVVPKNDSLLPVTNFIKEDIEHIISSLAWESREYRGCPDESK